VVVRGGRRVEEVGELGTIPRSRAPCVVLTNRLFGTNEIGMETTVAIVTIVTGVVALVAWLTGKQSLPEMFRKRRVERNRSTTVPTVGEAANGKMNHPVKVRHELSTSRPSHRDTDAARESLSTGESTETWSPEVDSLLPSSLLVRPADRGDELAVELTNMTPAPMTDCRVILLSVKRWSEQQRQLLADASAIGPLTLPGPTTLDPEVPTEYHVCRSEPHGGSSVRYKFRGLQDGSLATLEFDPRRSLVCAKIQIACGVKRRTTEIFFTAEGIWIRKRPDPRIE
jgi:hypothetical protein